MWPEAYSSMEITRKISSVASNKPGRRHESSRAHRAEFDDALLPRGQALPPLFVQHEAARGLVAYTVAGNDMLVGLRPAQLTLIKVRPSGCQILFRRAPITRSSWRTARGRLASGESALHDLVAKDVLEEAAMFAHHEAICPSIPDQVNG
jgi:hypothetical protein